MELNSTEISYEADIYSYIFLVLFLKFTPATTMRTVSKNLCSACIIHTLQLLGLSGDQSHPEVVKGPHPKSLHQHKLRCDLRRLVSELSWIAGHTKNQRTVWHQRKHTRNTKEDFVMNNRRHSYHSRLAAGIRGCVPGVETKTKHGASPVVQW